MASIKSKMFRFLLKYRHLLEGHIKSPVIDYNTSIVQLREAVRKSAAKMTKMPKGIIVSPADFPNFYSEWVALETGKEDQAILYFHGSGFVMGSSKDHRALVANFVARCGVNYPDMHIDAF